MHFLVHSVPTLSPKQIVQKIKSITAIQTLEKHPEIKKILRGGAFCTDGYYVNSVGGYGNIEAVMRYVKQQGGKTYKSIHTDIKQLSLFG